MTESKLIQEPIKTILNKLNFTSDSVILLHESNDFSHKELKLAFDYLSDFTPTASLVVMGDCNFNVDALSEKMRSDISSQERMVMSSGLILQLLTLKEQSDFVSHPSLMIGSLGKYSKYLARKQPLDFPYGEQSAFNDLYNLDAIVLFLGDSLNVYEGIHAYSKITDFVIRKNSCIYKNDMESYLDYQVDLNGINDLLYTSGLCVSETFGNSKIHGIRYQDMIDYLKMHL